MGLLPREDCYSHSPHTLAACYFWLKGENSMRFPHSMLICLLVLCLFRSCLAVTICVFSNMQVNFKMFKYTLKFAKCLPLFICGFCFFLRKWICFFSSLKRNDKSIGVIWRRIILKVAPGYNSGIFKELLVFVKSWRLGLILKYIYDLLDSFSKNKCCWVEWLVS